MATPTPLQKGSELIGRAIAADTSHQYDTALPLYEQAIEFLRQAIALESNISAKEGIASKVSEYERRVFSIKQALGKSVPNANVLPAMPSVPKTAPPPAASAAAAPPRVAAPPPSSAPPPPSAAPPPPSAAPPAPLASAPPPSAPAPAPYAAAPPPVYTAPPPGYPPAAPPGYAAWPSMYPYPYPYPPPPPPAYGYPYPPPVAAPAALPSNGALDSWNVPLGSHLTNTGYSSPLPPSAPMPMAAAPPPPQGNTVFARPMPMADHSPLPVAGAGRPVHNEITHGTWDGGQTRLRAETPSDVVSWGSMIRVRVTIANSSSSKIEHIRLKLKVLDESYRAGSRERRVTLMVKDFYDGFPMKSGNYDKEVLFQMPPALPSRSGVSHYISVSCVMGMLTKNLHVRLPIRFVQ